MSLVEPLVISLLGTRIASRSKRLQSVLEKQLAQFAREAPKSDVHLRAHPWIQPCVAIILLVGVVLFPWAMVRFVYVPVQQALFGTGGLLIPYDGQYVFMIICVLMWSILFLVVFGVVRKLFSGVDVYMTAVDVRQQLQMFGNLERAKGRAAGHAQLEQIAAKYDLKRFSTWRLKRTALALVVLSVLSAPFLFAALQSYIVVRDSGMHVNGLWTLNDNVYAWSDIESTQVRVDSEEGQDSEVHRVPKFEVATGDGAVIDLWQFGVLKRPASDIIALCTLFDDHGIAVEQRSLPDISPLRASIQQDVHAVFDSPQCGAFSVCDTLPADSSLKDLLECK